jgi:methyl-accepting chemotaxis protein
MKMKSKISLSFVLVAGIMTLVGAVGMASLVLTNSVVGQYTRNLTQKDYARLVDTAQFEAQAAEKEFLLTGDPKLKDEVKTNLDELLKHARAIMDLSAADPEARGDAAQIVSLAGRYDFAFRQVADILITKGNLESGIEGQLIAKGDEAELEIQANGGTALVRAFGQIRRLEKEVILEGSKDEAVTRLTASLESVSAAVARSGARGGQAAKLLQEYTDLLSQFVTLDAKIAADIEAYGRIFDAMDPLIDKLLTETEASAATRLAAVASMKNTTLGVVVAGIAVGIVGAILCGIFLTRVVTSPLSAMVGAAQRIAGGDLSQEIKVRNKDEFGDLSMAFNTMSAHVSAMMRQVRDAASQVAGSSEEISASARQLSSGAQGQAATLEETSASVEQLTASVGQVSQSAQAQASFVENSSDEIKKLSVTVEQMSKTLASVSEAAREATEKARQGTESVTTVVKAIKSISESSEKIAGIISVISDIADQTNLLALNASIEAARAGEHGRGFAVVAEEVSKLADRSASSTKEIEVLIGTSAKTVGMGVQIAEASQAAMDAIITGAKRTSQLVDALSGDLRQGLEGIRAVSKAITDISGMSDSISAATEEQTTNSRQVSKAIENVNELTQQASASAEEMSAATIELSTMASRLEQLVTRFTLGEEIDVPAKVEAALPIGELPDTLPAPASVDPAG